jgi:hypothetical protein
LPGCPPRRSCSGKIAHRRRTIDTPFPGTCRRPSLRCHHCVGWCQPARSSRRTSSRLLERNPRLVRFAIAPWSFCICSRWALAGERQGGRRGRSSRLAAGRAVGLWQPGWPNAWP